jgi:twinkle protein
VPLDYARSRNWEYRERGSQLNIRACPLCDDSGWHFYMNKETGQWDCKKCQESGSLFQLKKHLGDIEEAIHPAYRRSAPKKPESLAPARYHQALLRDKEAMDYLVGRKIGLETIKRFQLGVRSMNGAKWLCIPHWENQNVVNIKYRSLPPAKKEFLREPGCRSVLFNVNALAVHRQVLITEGEMDALSLVEHGFENAVGATNGAGAFDAEWVKDLEKAERIYLCFDTDEAGRKGAVSLAKRLGYNRCWNIALPCNDVNDFFLQHTREEFDQLIQQAAQFNLPGVIDVRAALDLLQGEEAKEKESKGLQTPWENVNRIIHGWKPGDLVIVTALPKTGKTTWMLDITRHLVLGWVPVLFFCLEMRPERLVRKVIQAQYRIEQPGLKEIRNARMLFDEIPLYFGYFYKHHKTEDILGLIREAVQRYGIQLIVFDNLHLLCRTDRVNEQIAQATLAFKLLAEEMEVPVVLIAQPRKRENSSTEIMSAEDVRYSSAVHSDCDQMIILHRNRTASKARDINSQKFIAREESMDPVTLVRVEAHRYGSGGETLLYYNGAFSRFDLLERNESSGQRYP